MKEWIVDIYPTSNKGWPSKVRVFAANQAIAFQIAKEMYPNYKPFSAKLVND